MSVKSPLILPIVALILLWPASHALAAITAQQASELAQQHVPGRVLAVKQRQYQGRAVYQVKLLNPQGEVHVIFLDADSGKRVTSR